MSEQLSSEDCAPLTSFANNTTLLEHYILRRRIKMIVRTLHLY